ncbi:MAG: methionine adenosyltransferase [Thermoprotei archaeon]|nr:MAG: methionine adenosyltransferase [Thermoprotei archaeon]
MRRNILVERLNATPMDERPYEIVERKGLGHPDYIADSIAEVVSRALCKYYLDRYGVILHHNVDKVLVVGGEARPEFRGGQVVRPIYVLVAGRVTTEVETESGRESVPVGSIILSSSKRWLRENFRFLDPESHVIIDYKVGRGSTDLVSMYKRGLSQVPLANDTSLGLSFAPLSTTERLVLEVERYLNSPDLKKRLPQVGEDVKVMAFRRGAEVRLTVAAAIISRLVADKDEYFSVKEEIKEEVLKLATKIAPDYDVSVDVNTADDPSDPSSLYLVVTGTSAEHGDDGATGRGNRVHGLITPMRPMSLEATAGKNPVSHVGKIYNVLASVAAERIAAVDGVREAYVEVLSQIGKPIDQPQVALVSLVVEEGASFNSAKYESEAILDDLLSDVTKLTGEIVEGRVGLF